MYFDVKSQTQDESEWTVTPGSTIYITISSVNPGCHTSQQGKLRSFHTHFVLYTVDHFDIDLINALAFFITVV